MGLGSDAVDDTDRENGDRSRGTMTP